jgi:hypothetical protein
MPDPTGDELLCSLKDGAGELKMSLLYDATTPPICNDTNLMIDGTSTIWSDIKSVALF